MRSFVEAPDRTLYQFADSPAGETARWTLDAKGLPYATRDLVPGVHVLALRRAGVPRTAAMPVLVDRGTPVAGAEAIARHVERAYPNPALLPSHPSERARALELQAYFAEELGPHVPRWIYGQLLHERGALTTVALRGHPAAVRALGQLAAAALEHTVRRMHQITPVSVERARAAIVASAARLERETRGDPGRYLVGQGLTVADITAAALLAPIVVPFETRWDAPFEYPRAMLELREFLRRRAAGHWVIQRYQLDRNRGIVA